MLLLSPSGDEVDGFPVGEVCSGVGVIGSVAPEFGEGVGEFDPNPGVGVGVVEVKAATVTVLFVHVQLISLFSFSEPLGMSLINATSPIVIGEVPAARTVNVIVARPPLPLTVSSSARAQFISGISPLLKAKVELKDHRKKVGSLLLRNGPSWTFVMFKTLGLKLMF
jgi:hypothetical protein